MSKIKRIRIITVILCAAFTLQMCAAAGAAAMLFANRFTVPLYSSSAMIMYTDEDSDWQIGDTIDGDEAKKRYERANEFATLLSGEPSINEKAYGIKELKIKAFEDSQFIIITATAEKAEATANAANEIARKAEIIYNANYESGRIMLVESANVPAKPSSPDIALYVILGAIGGLILGGALSVIVYVLINKAYLKKHNNEGL